jgi:CBS domain-containing protein
MVKNEILDFLKKTPPFDLLSSEILELVIDRISLEFYPRGFMILSQNGQPCTSLRIIKKGGVKVYMANKEGDEVVNDYRSEGDTFGYLSLISGDKSRANVLAIEDTICYQIPKDTILRIVNNVPLVGQYFMQSFFMNFIDKAYEEMIKRSLVFGEEDKLLYTTPVKDLIAKDAVTSTLEISIKTAAGIMSEHKISSLILVDELEIPVGIITDRDLRDKVVARGLDISKSVREIMSPPFIRVDSHETCFEALVKMIQFKIHHLIVVENGKLTGVLTNHDFIMLQGTSPLSLAKYIENQKSVEGLLSIHDKINHTISILFKDGVKAGYIMRIITELNDRLIQKIIELCIKETGPSPGPFTFIVYGSEGRKEQTFKTVFDCAIIYGDQKDSDHKKELNYFIKKLFTQLQEVFKRLGFNSFNLSGENFPVYGELSEWEKTFIHSLTSGDEKQVLTAKKFLDLRPIYGEPLIANTLKNRLFKLIQDHPDHMSVLVNYAIKQESPLGFFKQFVVERSGEHRDELDIKEKGIMPVVDSLRVIAIAQNVLETSTIERLNAISTKSDVLFGLNDDIASAFEFLLHLRIEDQLREKELHMDIDDFIEPSKLSLLEKNTLKEVFKIIPRLQDAVVNFFQRQGVMA